MGNYLPRGRKRLIISPYTASTGTRTYQFMHEKRGSEALLSEASVLKDYKGRAIHDCLAVWAGRMRQYLLDLLKQPRPIQDGEAVRAKVKLKVSGCFRTQGGGRNLYPFAGYHFDIAQTGKGVFDALRDMMRGQPAAITTS